MPLAIYLAAVSASVLPMMAVCALASVVAAGTANPPVGYGRPASAGALIGMAFGIAGFYLLIMPSSALASLLPLEWDHLAYVSVRTVFIAVAAAISALTTAPLVTRSESTAPSGPKPAVVGGVFGLAAGIANGAIGMVIRAIELFPTDVLASDLSALAITFVIFTASFIFVIIIVDVALAMLAFRFIRRRCGVVGARSR